MILSSFTPEFQETIRQVASFVSQEEPLYLVGGAIRDALSGRKTHDLDFVLRSRAIQTGRRIANALNADFYPLDVERDAGRLIIHQPQDERLTIDFAAQRGPTIESDLQERDFTINALALDVHCPDALLDPTGGITDLRLKRLRECSTFSFINDPIRVLRAVRFSLELGLQISPETTNLIRAALPDLGNVSMERLRDELFRILEGNSPWSAIRLLDMLGALPLVLPELSALKGLQQPLPHTHDAFDHSVLMLEILHELLEVIKPLHEPEEGTNWRMGLVSLKLGRYRGQLQQHLNEHINPERSLLSLLSFAAVYHDTGKFVDHQLDADGTLHFYGHEKTSTQLIRERSEILRLSSAEIDRLSRITSGHMRPLWLSKRSEGATPKAIHRFFRRTGPAGVDICLLSLADMLATYGTMLPQDTWLRHVDLVRILLEAYWERSNTIISPVLLLNGNEIMTHLKLKPGPQIGKLLELLREAQAVGEVKTREQALSFLESFLNQG